MNEAIGYKRPPAKSRFQPGRSGNPSGRPKRALSFSVALLAELAEAVPAADRKRAHTKLQAFIRKLVDAAIAGNARSQAILVAALARIGDVEAHEPNATNADDREILEAYLGGELERRANETKPASASGDEKM